MLNLKSIDHVHLYVTDRTSAEKWYFENLGFKRVQKFEQWVDGGPLTIANGKVHLALFTSKAPQETTVAFGVNSKDFLLWKEHLEVQSIEFTTEDHNLSWSMYFSDPDGNPFEITTYEYDELKNSLKLQA